MKRLATALLAISALAIAVPAIAKNHTSDATHKTTTKAERKAKWENATPEERAQWKAKHKARKHKHRGKHAQHYDLRSKRHTYPGSSSSYANRHENGVGIGSAVVKH